MVAPATTATVQLHLRLHPGRDDDLSLWLRTLTPDPYGSKAQAIKAALRRGLTAVPTAAAPAGTAGLDLSGWLPEIRRALAAELDQRQVTLAPGPAPVDPDAALTTDLLAQLDAALLAPLPAAEA